MKKIDIDQLALATGGADFTGGPAPVSPPQDLGWQKSVMDAWIARANALVALGGRSPALQRWLRK